MFSKKKKTKIEKRAPIKESIIIFFVLLLIFIFLASFKEDIIYAPHIDSKKVESPFYAFNVFVVNAYTYKSYRHN